MLQLLIYFFIGLSLSMDTFSLSLSIGTTSPTTKQIIKTSIIVGIFHFIMPLFGSTIGNIFSKNIIQTNYITFTIFIILALQMFLNRNSEEKVDILTVFSMILFAISVSLDSFSVGIAFGITKESIIISGLIFSIVSATFTYLGLKLGKKLTEKYQEKTTYLGILLMLIIAFKYLLTT
ncbi:MAG: hypothetical protein HFE81_01075 [Bacilli bacterium]|nr:hypothetical protein [Bacilli bacterium]